MAQNHNADYSEKPMTTYGRTQGPSRRYRRLRHPTFPAAEWTAKNPLLQRGEIGIESDTHKIKIGDGITYWNNLPYSQDDGQPKSTADYNMGNSSGGWTAMSTAQQDALNSGATTTNITQIGTNTTTIDNHIANTNNPHSVTKSQVGLGNVDNTSDADKPISTATQSALDGKQAKSASDYNMGNSTGGWTAMTTGQQNALNSGATTTNIGQIATNTSNIANEIIDRQNADNGLQGQIDAIVAKSDVVDIVGTYAQLQAYDTSGLGNNDVVKVISDSTHNDAPSYYRWVISGGVGSWVYIGSEAETYTKAETDTLLNAKQDVLTAGSNITISGNTISATDTTYTGSDGIALTGTNFTNSGVRSVASGTANGTISVNTNGTTADVAVTGLGSAAYTASTAYATAAQGSKADTAVQPGDLASVATSGLYSDLTGTPSLATVATSGDYDDLTNKPTIPAAQVNSDWNAVSGVAEILNKPTLATVATSGSYNDLSNKPTIPAAQVNSDWDAVSGVSQILNKPTLAAVATSGSYTDLTNKPTIPAAQVNSDWDANSGVAQILNKPTLATVATSGAYSDLSGTPSLAAVATSGSYNDLSNKPTIPTVNDATLTIQKNGTNVATFTANASSGVTANITVPTTPGDIGAQAALTAGTNIQITGTTISATDTTYSNFTGATAGDAGASGLVPAPAAGDQAKFLQGDGTWANPTAATAWGNITGTLSDQTDLQSALNGKADIATTLSGYGITDGANTALSNITSAGKNVCASMTLPDTSRYTELTIGASETNYTAPADGWFSFDARIASVGYGVGLIYGANNDGHFESRSNCCWTNQVCGVVIPVNKGQIITISYTAFATTNPRANLRFYYAKGAQ